MARWFTSDLHVHDAKTLQYNPRRGNNVREMTEMLIGKWNSVVKPEDTCYCVGDFSRSMWAVAEVTHRLQGRKELIVGNHEHAHPAHKYAQGEGALERWVNKYYHHGWDALHYALDLRLDDGHDGIHVLLNHMPYLNEEDSSQNYKEYRLKDDGVPLICGHVHGAWQMRFTRKLTPQLNVGVDVHDMTPISEQAVLDYFNHMLSGEYHGPETRNWDLREKG